MTLRWAPLALLFFACTPTEPPTLPGAATLVGHRTHDGTQPWFDRDARPVVRIEAADLRGWHLAVESGHRGATPKTTTETHAGGTLLRVSGLPEDLPPGPGFVRLQTPDGRTAKQWAVRWTRSPEALLLPAAEARRAKNFARARAFLDGLPDTPEARLWAPVERARMAQTANVADAAILAWQAAAAAAEHVPLERSRRLQAAAYVAHLHRDFAQEQALLDEAAAAAAGIQAPVEAAQLSYMRGLLQWAVGDFRAAEHAMAQSERVLRRYGVHAHADMAAESRALALADLGDHAAASQLLDSLASKAGARFALNAAWVALGQPDATPTQRAEAVRRLERARAEMKGQPRREANAVANLAWAALLDGRVEQGRALIAEARRLDPKGEGFAGIFVDLVDGALLIRAGHPRAALEACKEVEGRARTEVDGRAADAVWRAQLCQARALSALGLSDDALGQYRQGLATVDALARGTSVLGARAVFHEARRALVDEALELLISKGRVAEAFAIADGARARSLRALQVDARLHGQGPEARRAWAERVSRVRAANAAWQALVRRAPLVPEAERPQFEADLRQAEAARYAALEAAYASLGNTPVDPIAPRDLGDARVVFLHPLAAEWLVFDVSAAGVRARRVTAQDDPFEPIGAGAHVYVVAGGHPLGLRGVYAGPNALIHRAPVSFLPHAGLLHRPLTSPEPRLVVADPRRDLVWARREGQTLAQQPGATLLVGAQATRAAVVEALGAAGTFHFAGHGVLNPADPWAAHLALHDTDRLDLPAVLARPLRARLVFLNGCETAPDSVVGDTRVVGLAEGFLAAGARSVVATDRRVPDATAEAFVRQFYAADGADQPGVALRAAVLALRAAGDPNWAAFRLFGQR